MKPYPFSPEILDAMPEELAELFRDLELKLLQEICSRLKIADNLNEVTIQDIKALRSHGIDLKEIKKAIEKATGKGADELNKLMDDAVARNQQYYTEVIDFAKITQPEELVSAADIARIREQTEGEFTNITRSMGFLLTKGGKKVMLEPAKAYQWALDKAEMQIQSGAISYSQAISEAVKELADSGIKTVNYESGHVDNVDVAVRRAVMTGISQLSDRYVEEAMRILKTDFCEVSAHIGARDVDGPKGWENHKAWQGRVYSIKENDKYPNIYETCGLGAVDGLRGANCRHRRFPFVDGISERTYTDEQLDNIDPPPFEYEGRTYTMYEATQKQRAIERTARKLKTLKASYEYNGQTEKAMSTNIRLRRVNAKYREFSKAAGLPEQPERMKAYKPLAKETVLSDNSNAVRNHNITEKAIESVQKVIPDGWGDEQATKLQKLHKSLLKTMKDYPTGYEGAVATTLDLKPLSETIIGENGRVYIPRYNVPYIVLHTHPDGEIFSHTDLSSLITNDNMRGLTIVGNNGAVYAAIKTADYIKSAANDNLEIMLKEVKEHIQNKNLDGYFESINKFLVEADSYGLSFKRK